MNAQILLSSNIIMGNECCSCLFNVNPTKKIIKKSKTKTENDNRKYLLQEDSTDDFQTDDSSQTDADENNKETPFNPFKRSAGK